MRIESRPAGKSAYVTLITLGPTTPFRFESFVATRVNDGAARSSISRRRAPWLLAER